MFRFTTGGSLLLVLLLLPLLCHGQLPSSRCDSTQTSLEDCPLLVHLEPVKDGLHRSSNGANRGRCRCSALTPLRGEPMFFTESSHGIASPAMLKERIFSVTRRQSSVGAKSRMPKLQTMEMYFLDNPTWAHLIARRYFRALQLVAIRLQPTAQTCRAGMCPSRRSTCATLETLRNLGNL
jgi:hypothetical protein